MISEKNIPMRRCTGCMTSKPKNELVRIVKTENGLEVDETGRKNGRGAYVCPSRDCFEKAVKRRAIPRSLKLEVTAEEMERLYQEFERYGQ